MICLLQTLGIVLWGIEVNTYTFLYARRPYVGLNIEEESKGESFSAEAQSFEDAVVQLKKELGRCRGQSTFLFLYVLEKTENGDKKLCFVKTNGQEVNEVDWRDLADATFTFGHVWPGIYLKKGG